MSQSQYNDLPEQAVYLLANASNSSFSGCLNDEIAITEQQICDYIQFSRPDLYHRLKFLPVASTDTRFCVSETKRLLLDEQASSFGIYASTKSTANHPNTTSYGQDIDLDMIDDYARLSLTQALCAYPGCQNAGTLNPRDNISSSAPHHKANTDTSAIYYCWECFKSIFGDKPAMEPATWQMNVLDGPREGSVMAAALRLQTQHVSDDQNESRSENLSGLAFTHPSNSVEAIKLRSHQATEIVRTLQQAEKLEKHISRRENSASPTLMISPPPGMPPAEERYKKQGLTKSDKWGKKKGDLITETQTCSSIKPRLRHKDEARYCYCHEPGEPSQMLKCCSDKCLIGWIHFECSGLKGPPYLTDNFFCHYCSDHSSAIKSPTKVSTGHSTPVIPSPVIVDSECNKCREDLNDCTSGDELHSDALETNDSQDEEDEEEEEEPYTLSPGGFQSVNTLP